MEGLAAGHLSGTMLLGPLPGQPCADVPPWGSLKLQMREWDLLDCGVSYGLQGSQINACAD